MSVQYHRSEIVNRTLIEPSDVCSVLQNNSNQGVDGQKLFESLTRRGVEHFHSLFSFFFADVRLSRTPHSLGLKMTRNFLGYKASRYFFNII